MNELGTSNIFKLENYFDVGLENMNIVLNYRVYFINCNA